MKRAIEPKDHDNIHLRELHQEAKSRNLPTLAMDESNFPSIFRQTLIEVMENSLGAGTSDALLFYIGEESLDDPEREYSGLKSILGEGATALHKEICERFSSEVMFQEK